MELLEWVILESQKPQLQWSFSWGQLRINVEDFCRRCDLCRAHTDPTDQSRAQLQQLVMRTPMERVAGDSMGPIMS